MKSSQTQKKMKEISMEDSQLKTHEISCGRTFLHLNVHNDYNNEKNINCSNPELIKEKIVEGYQWKTHELSKVVEENLSLKVNIVATMMGILIVQILD